jgi:hypothetical protein
MLEVKETRSKGLEKQSDRECLPLNKLCVFTENTFWHFPGHVCPNSRKILIHLTPRFPQVFTIIVKLWGINPVTLIFSH